MRCSLTFYAALYRDTKEPLFAARIAETIGWLEAEMMTDEGAFAASLDADTQGEEGRFYVWDKAEIEALLGAEADAFCAAYDITEKGNFEGRAIPHLLASGDTPQAALRGAREKLLSARNQRPRPGRDDKILADWNAMMVTALTQAAQIFDRPDWLALAETAFAAARRALSDANGQLFHAARDARRLDVSLAADYAFMGQAAAALYAATGKPDYCAMAEADAHRLDAHFADGERGGYRTNEADEAALLVNNRAVQDNAQPSANAAAQALFSSLAVLTGNGAWDEKAANGFQALAGHLAQNYPSMTGLLSAHYERQYSLSIIIIGDGAPAKQLADAAHRHPIFHRHILVLPPMPPCRAGHPAHGKQMIDGVATAYICPGQSCLAPLTAPDELIAALDGLLAQRQDGNDKIGGGQMTEIEHENVRLPLATIILTPIWRIPKGLQRRHCRHSRNFRRQCRD